MTASLNLLVEARHDRAHGAAVERRRRDGRQIAQPADRHLERSRDRRRRQREDVDVRAELLDPLLVRDAEALLFVDDEEAEVLEVDVLRQEAMRPDDDVDLAVLQAATASRPAPSSFGSARAARWRSGSRASAPRTCGSAAARAPSSGTGRRPACPPSRRGTPRESRPRSCRTRRRRRRGGPSAARASRSLVHVVDRLRLIRRLVERERRFERAVVVVGGGERVARLRLALGVETRSSSAICRTAFFDARSSSSRTSSRRGDRSSAARSRRRSTSDLVEPIDRQVQLVARAYSTTRRSTVIPPTSCGRGRGICRCRARRARRSRRPRASGDPRGTGGRASRARFFSSSAVRARRRRLPLP